MDHRLFRRVERTTAAVEPSPSYRLTSGLVTPTLSLKAAAANLFRQ